MQDVGCVCRTQDVDFFFGNQFHYPLHGEKARFGLQDVDVSVELTR